MTFSQMWKMKHSDSETASPFEGVLLVNKPAGKTSFYLVHQLRKRLGIQKIGHAGTLDPFATGVMVMLVGRNYTRLSDQLLCNDKEYTAQVFLGKSTDTYDCDGIVQAESNDIPTLEDVKQALTHFQDEIFQTPPMFSAKKVGGQKLYHLARQGITIERKPVKISLTTTFLGYDYPYLELSIACSKGTYIRSIAHELGIILGCGAHLSSLKRVRSGKFLLKDCIDGSALQEISLLPKDFLTKQEVLD